MFRYAISKKTDDKQRITSICFYNSKTEAVEEINIHTLMNMKNHDDFAELKRVSNKIRFYNGIYSLPTVGETNKGMNLDYVAVKVIYSKDNVLYKLVDRYGKTIELLRADLIKLLENNNVVGIKLINNKIHTSKFVDTDVVLSTV